MTDPSTLLRRNFTVALIAHAALIGVLLLSERWLPDFTKPVATPVQLVVPADILGELPKGPGYGRGPYAPPKEAVALPRSGGGTETTPPPRTENAAHAPKTTTAKVPPPKTTATKNASDSTDGIAIPKPGAKTAKSVTSKSASSASTSTTGAKATKAESARTPTQVASAASGFSAEQSRAGFLSALRRYGGGTGVEGGTPYGDNRPAGGGTGRGRIGSPDGAPDGVAGGIGQGSPHWQYFLHVRDRLYEAWDQPGVANDRKLTAAVVITVARDGSIVGVTLKRSSGNRLMDNSVLAAVRKVRMLEPPPEPLVKGSTAEIFVDFHMEG